MTETTRAGAVVELAAAEPDRYVVLDASQPVDEVASAVATAVSARVAE